MATIFIDLDRTSQWFVFQAPYNEAFIYEFKARIPANHRRWVGDRKAWCVTRRHWAVTEPLLRKHYGHSVTFEVGPAAEAAQLDLMVDEVSHEPTAMDYMKLGLRADAPHCVVHAAYCALATLWERGDRDEIRLLGVSPMNEVYDAYKRVCQLRGITLEGLTLHKQTKQEEVTVTAMVTETVAAQQTPASAPMATQFSYVDAFYVDVQMQGQEADNDDVDVEFFDQKDTSKDTPK